METNTTNTTNDNRVPNLIDAGCEVEVFCTLTHRWVGGFAVVAAGPIGYRVCRQHDGLVIPEVMPLKRVRVA